MPYDFGDVVLVRFPYTNQIGSKQRPAVVVSSRTYNDARPDIVMMAITSQIRYPLGHAETQISDWQSANLAKPSVVKPLFATVEQTLVLRQLGSLSPSDLSALRSAISVILS